jgi:hypothetical protein
MNLTTGSEGKLLGRVVNEVVKWGGWAMRRISARSFDSKKARRKYVKIKRPEKLVVLVLRTGLILLLFFRPVLSTIAGHPANIIITCRMSCR